MFIPVLTPVQIQAVHALDTVIQHRTELSSRPVVSFTCDLPDDIKASIHAALGLDLSSVTDVPMRWIQGDTLPHADSASNAASFDHTYIVYLSSTAGELFFDDQTFPIQEGYGITFNEGIRHGTANTGSTSRLLIGPMNEHGQPVGSPMVYFASEADALSYTNAIGYGGSWTVESFNGITAWRIASNSTGSSSQQSTYYVGDLMNSDGSYFFYPNAPCLLQGTTVRCLINGSDQDIPIEQIRPGTTVKTAEGYHRVALVGHSIMINPGSVDRSQNRLYVCKPAEYPELKSDLYLTGCHSILVDQLTPAQITKTQEEFLRVTHG